MYVLKFLLAEGEGRTSLRNSYFVYYYLVGTVPVLCHKYIRGDPTHTPCALALLGATAA